MANPWLKKNPFMSMWLSAANRAAGTLRGQVTAEARRQVKAAVVDALTPTAAPPARKAKPGPRSRGRR